MKLILKKKPVEYRLLMIKGVPTGLARKSLAGKKNTAQIKWKNNEKNLD